ncbi:cyanophycinase [Streptomyces sp. 142MFCol3.1]|uniref:cyanophycinase n=1 Tax=Streptomyces sp. 142MFCol3.1 TaxID=1172179 RepID=UPI0003F9DB94|nr:cyanophycinase [Streptomyces sp. 142MFCol3.1]
MTRRPLLSRRTALTAGIACILALNTQPAQAAGPRPTPHGSLVLVGGALASDNNKVYNEIIERAGGAKARIGILTAASVPESQDPHASDPDRCSNSACNGVYYSQLFTQHGADDAEWIPIDLDHISAADDDRVVDQINRMTGFFFGGGDQYRYITTLLHGDAHTDTKALAAIRTKLAHGAVVSGSSAGAQIMAGADMVTGGESYQALRDGSTPGYFEDPTRLGYLPAGGFGFLTSGLVDTHTGVYGREGRSLRLAADTGHNRVYALEENTALIVDNPGTRHETMTVSGPNGVAILDLRHARTPQTTPWTLHGARYSYLTDSDHYNSLNWKAQPGPTKHRTSPDTTAPVPANNDVFYSASNPDGVPYSLRGTARALAATTNQRTATASTYEQAPRFTVQLAKNKAFTMWAADTATPPSLIDMQLTIAPR